ncbi:MAG: uracil-DNA glycosylase [Cocleimonas sp.]|nr:uracil-DNA glycosylase [Cocleimonas sp.]
MGIPVWVGRDTVDSAIFETKADRSTVDSIAQQQSVTQLASPNQLPIQNNPIYQQAPSPQAPSSHTAQPPAFSTENLFNAIDQAAPVNQPQSASSIADSLKEKIEKTELIDSSSFDWQQLQQAVTDCQQCELYNKRTHVVFGEGKQNSTWMIIGDAPKEEEDTQGRPFMDRSGVLLDNMLTAIGLDRPSVYLANTLKCRPPNNRDPKKAESKTCYGYLKRQIQLVNPTLILIVGRIAAQHLLQTREPLARLRGRRHTIEELNIPVVVTYHPAYLLRQPRDKYKSWQDLKLAQSILAEVSGDQPKIQAQ